MTNKERKQARYAAGLAQMSVEERDALQEAIGEALELGAQDRGRIINAVIGIVAARGRALQRYRSNKATDRRELVGAHVPVELAQQVKALAAERGVSVYRFLVDTLEEVVTKRGR